MSSVDNHVWGRSEEIAGGGHTLGWKNQCTRCLIKRTTSTGNRCVTYQLPGKRKREYWPHKTRNTIFVPPCSVTDEQAKFRDSLERSREVVKKWPQWMREGSVGESGVRDDPLRKKP